MLDELFEVFERDNQDGRRRANGERPRGVRGFFARMFGGGDDYEDDYREDRRDRDRRYDDDDDDYGYSGRSRRRERDLFDFGDD